MRARETFLGILMKQMIIHVNSCHPPHNYSISEWNLIQHLQPCSPPQPSFLKVQKPQVYSDLSIQKRNNINLLVAFLFNFFLRLRSHFFLLVIMIPVITYKKKVYKGCLTPETSILLKHRFRKNYRHSTLDASLTKMRVAGEARALLRCLRYVSFFSPPALFWP